MEKIKYNKPALCVEEQIELLKSRGLVINDENFAQNILSNITYYRLSSYMKFFQNSDKFKSDTTFEDIVYLSKILSRINFKNIKAIAKLTLLLKNHLCSNFEVELEKLFCCYDEVNLARMEFKDNSFPPTFLHL